MKSTNDVIDVLNDLAKINNDRIAGYQTAIEYAKTIDMDLVALFTALQDDSQQIGSELNQALMQLGGVPEDDSTLSGKIHRTWLDIKASFTGKDRGAILSSCEFGDDAILKAYDTALTDGDLPADVVTMLTQQRAKLQQGHDKVKAARDMEAAVN